MASSPKLVSLFLLSLLFIQIHGRESNFFSKVPNNNGETQIPNKVDPLTNSEKTTTPQDQDPIFIPQTQDNGYGLYGHESPQFSPSDAKFSDPNARTGGRPFSTTTTYDDGENNGYKRNDDVSYKSESDEYYNNNYNNDNFHNSNWKKPYENSFYYNKDLYDNRRQSFQNTRLSRDEYTTTATTTPSYNQEKYNDDNNNNNFYVNNRGNNENNNNNFYVNNRADNENNNMVRQGMSDTRFMENGKYFYDLNREPKHHSRSNFRNNNYNNNANTYEYNNSMGRYQNDETEFQEESDEFVP